MTEINREALFFAKTLAVSVTPVPPPGTHPDRDLLAACAALDAAEREHHTFFYGPDRIDDDDARNVALEPVEAERDRLVREVCKLRATTLEGYLARVRVLMLEDLELDPAEDARSRYLNVSLLGALIRDLAEHAGARRPT